MSKIREVVCKRWLLKKTIDGITIYPFIFYNGPPSDKIKKHEWAHVRQVQECMRECGIVGGWFAFYIVYIVFSIKFGAKNNPFEIEAYEESHPEEQNP